jgi:hypothetical protein
VTAGIFYGPAVVVVSCCSEPEEVDTYVMEVSEYMVDNGMEVAVESHEVVVCVEPEVVSRREMWAVASGLQGMATEEVLLGDTEAVPGMESEVVVCVVPKVVAGTENEAVVCCKLGVVVSGDQGMGSEEVVCMEM